MGFLLRRRADRMFKELKKEGYLCKITLMREKVLTERKVSTDN